MSTLRKACRNCTTSRRKCVIQLPRCTRCAQKGLECMYDLEPFWAPTGQPENTFCYDSPGYCIIRKLELLASGTDPAVCKPGVEDTLEIVRFGFQSVPDLVRAGKPAVFVHPKLRLHSNRNHVAVFGETASGSMNCEHFEDLVQLNVKAMPVQETLTALQALLVYLATFLFFSGEAAQANAERHFGVLSEWTETLLASAQSGMPRNQSPWQQWLFGESVRRTIVMSYTLSLVLHSFKYGYCSNWLFVESLPFDRRAGLWMAESPQAWIAAARARNGEEVGEQLISCHEFSEELERLGNHFCGDTFLAVLAYGHNGQKRKDDLGPSGD